MEESVAHLDQAYMESIRILYSHYKKIGDGALEQVREEDINWAPDPESNSIAVIVKHIGGNMISRWSEFLTTDGEKPFRNRDGEFENDRMTKEQLLKHWDDGWRCVFGALDNIQCDTLTRIIKIRNEPNPLVKSLNHQLAHYAYHVGQLVYLVKMLRSSAWRTLTIPKRKA